jgi:GntR family transcriptional regulator
VGDEPPIEYRRSLIRGDRYALVASWSPRGYALGASDL